MAAATVAATNLAGAGNRFVSALIDGVILIVFLGILAVVAGAAGDAAGTIIVLGYLATLLYYPVLWAYWNGQSVGKRAMGIKVVKTDGSAIGFGSAILRLVGFFIDSIVFGLPIGYLWIFFDANKQCWHDKIAGTYVVRA